MSLKDFEFIKELGKGSFGSVSLVKRRADNLLYAIKKVNIAQMSDKEKQNALNEIRLLASLSSKQIIGYKDAFFDDNTQSLYIVMEYADDEDLDKKIKEKYRDAKHFSEDEVWFYSIQIIKGLKALHDKNIMHRDLKSANIFLTKEGRVKIGDLNVGKLIKENKLAITQTGTPYYASPEVWADLPYDYKADVWSLGCIIYEMCCLKTPFRAKNLPQLFETVSKGEYKPINKEVYSENLSNLINLMLQVDPKNRISLLNIFELDAVKKKIEFFRKKLNDKYPENCLLDSLEDINNEFISTIKVPNNLKDINNFLPKTKYNSDSNIEDSHKVTTNSMNKEYSNNNICLNNNKDYRPLIAKDNNNINIPCTTNLNKDKKNLNSSSRKCSINISLKSNKNNSEGDDLNIMHNLNNSNSKNNSKVYTRINRNSSNLNISKNISDINKNTNITDSNSKILTNGRCIKNITPNKISKNYSNVTPTKINNNNNNNNNIIRKPLSDNKSCKYLSNCNTNNSDKKKTSYIYSNVSVGSKPINNNIYNIDYSNNNNKNKYPSNIKLNYNNIIKNNANKSNTILTNKNNNERSKTPLDLKTNKNYSKNNVNNSNNNTENNNNNNNKITKNFSNIRIKCKDEITNSNKNISLNNNGLVANNNHYTINQENLKTNNNTSHKSKNYKNVNLYSLESKEDNYLNNKNINDYIKSSRPMSNPINKLDVKKLVKGKNEAHNYLNNDKTFNTNNNNFSNNVAKKVVYDDNKKSLTDNNNNNINNIYNSNLINKNKILLSNEKYNHYNNNERNIVNSIKSSQIEKDIIKNKNNPTNNRNY